PRRPSVQDTHSSEGALAPAHHKPMSMQHVRGLRLPVLLRDLGVVDVRAAFLHGATRSALALHESAGYEQLDDGRLISQPDLTRRDLGHRRIERGRVELTQITPAEKGLARGHDLPGLLRPRSEERRVGKEGRSTAWRGDEGQEETAMHAA